MRGAALTLGLSSLALALFPQFRPFFFFDPTHPMETMDAAAPAVTSGLWRVAHHLAPIALVLLLCVPPAPHPPLCARGAEAPPPLATPPFRPAGARLPPGPR